jgi:arylformamidase
VTDLPDNDYDDAYANGAHIAGAAELSARWSELRREFSGQLKQAWGGRVGSFLWSGFAHAMDLFLPEVQIQGSRCVRAWRILEGL